MKGWYVQWHAFVPSMIFMKDLLQMVAAFDLYLTVFIKEYFID